MRQQMKHTIIYLGRNSVMIDRFGGRVTAPIKRTTFGWRNLRIIRTLHNRTDIKELVDDLELQRNEHDLWHTQISLDMCMCWMTNTVQMILNQFLQVTYFPRSWWKRWEIKRLSSAVKSKNLKYNRAWHYQENVIATCMAIQWHLLCQSLYVLYLLGLCG